MDDLTATRLCAEAMGLILFDCTIDSDYDGDFQPWVVEKDSGGLYDPLHDDAQAMALVKKFTLSVGFNRGWGCVKNDENGMLLSGAYHFDSLNKAIVECAAAMQQAKK